MTPQQEQQLFVTETPRLTLRRIVPEDYLEAFAWRGDPRVCKYMAHAAAKQPEDFLPWLRQQDPSSDQRIICILHEKSDGHAVGNVGFFYHPEEDMWSFAYNIRYEDWNKGYTTEAVQALMEYVRKQYGAHTFEAEHAIGNDASGRVMEKCGLSYHHDSEYRNKDTGQVFPSKVYRLEE